MSDFDPTKTDALERGCDVGRVFGGELEVDEVRAVPESDFEYVWARVEYGHSRYLALRSSATPRFAACFRLRVLPLRRPAQPPPTKVRDTAGVTEPPLRPPLLAEMLPRRSRDQRTPAACGLGLDSGCPSESLGPLTLSAGDRDSSSGRCKRDRHAVPKAFQPVFRGHSLLAGCCTRQRLLCVFRSMTPGDGASRVGQLPETPPCGSCIRAAGGDTCGLVPSRATCGWCGHGRDCSW